VTCSPQQQQQVVVGGCCWLLVVGSLSVASNAIGGQVQGTPVYGYFSSSALPKFLRLRLQLEVSKYLLAQVFRYFNNSA